jgi:hypothetical protein
MPTYRFLNTETGEEFEDFLSNTKKEELLEKNPHINQMPSAFSIVSMVGTYEGKTDDTWKEVLHKVSEAHPDSPVAHRYGKKTTHQIKSRQIYNKWKNT